MGRYRSRSRSYSPHRRSRSPSRRKRYDDPRDRYRGGRSFNDRRSDAPSGLLVRNISLDARSVPFLPSLFPPYTSYSSLYFAWSRVFRALFPPTALAVVSFSDEYCWEDILWCSCWSMASCLDYTFLYSSLEVWSMSKYFLVKEVVKRREVFFHFALNENC